MIINNNSKNLSQSKTESYKFLISLSSPGSWDLTYPLQVLEDRCLHFAALSVLDEFEHVIRTCLTLLTGLDFHKMQLLQL